MDYLDPVWPGISSCVRKRRLSAARRCIVARRHKVALGDDSQRNSSGPRLGWHIHSSANGACLPGPALPVWHADPPSSPCQRARLRLPVAGCGTPLGRSRSPAGGRCAAAWRCRGRRTRPPACAGAVRHRPRQQLPVPCQLRLRARSFNCSSPIHQGSASCLPASACSARLVGTGPCRHCQPSGRVDTPCWIAGLLRRHRPASEQTSRLPWPARLRLLWQCSG